MLRLIPRVENSTAMVLLSPVLALTLTALSAYLIFIFVFSRIFFRLKYCFTVIKQGSIPMFSNLS